MPVDDTGAVLRASDQTVRSELIATHLARLEAALAETQRAVASLRDLLEHPSPSVVIEHRRVPATQAAAVTSAVQLGDLAAWYQGAVGEIVRILSAQSVVASGPPGGNYTRGSINDRRRLANRFSPI